MKAIDVQGLPENVAQALAQVVRTLREQMPAEREAAPARRPVELRTWPGKPLGTLTREEIYEDVG